MPIIFVMQGKCLLPDISRPEVVVSYKQKYVHELLVNRRFKLAQKKVWLGKLTPPPSPHDIAVARDV